MSTAYTWKGQWDAGAQGWSEFFGGDEGIPARDLNAAEVAAFSPAQRAKLESEAGKRLYEPVRGAKPGKGDADPGE